MRLHWKRRPYDQGIYDAEHGYTDCPYKPGTIQAKVWRAGFDSRKAVTK